MLIKRKRPRSHKEDRYLALFLSSTAGILNALALGAFGFFPSHMSGNTSQISNEVSHSDFYDALFLGSMLCAFFMGAFLTRILVIWGTRRHLRTIFCLVLLTEGGLLTLMALFELLFYSTSNNNEAIVFLAFLMGIHNTNSTQLSDGRVRSTHITGTLTDAGIALGSLICSLKSTAKISTPRKIFYTHVITLFSFLSGGFAGILLYWAFGFKTMAAVGIFMVAVALVTILMTIQRSFRRYSKILSSSLPENE